MRLLLDQNLSPPLADALRAAGHDVLHAQDLGCIVVFTEDRIRVRRLPIPPAR